MILKIKIKMWEKEYNSAVQKVSSDLTVMDVLNLNLMIYRCLRKIILNGYCIPLSIFYDIAIKVIYFTIQMAIGWFYFFEKHWFYYFMLLLLIFEAIPINLIVKHC